MIFFRSILSGYVRVAIPPASVTDTYLIPIRWHFIRIVASEISTKPRPRSFSSFKQLNEDGSAKQLLQTNSIVDFLRFKEVDGGVDGGVVAGLQTAVVSYRKTLPSSHLCPFLQVDLVSAIHMADKEYFATLRKELESYDCVLYEMVTRREYLIYTRNKIARKGLRRLRLAPQGFYLSCILRPVALFFKLDLQLHCLDYKAENWYHADLDYETYKLLQIEEGDTPVRYMKFHTEKAMLQPPSNLEDFDHWISELLWASRVLPLPLVGLLIIGSEYLPRLDLGAAMKAFCAKLLTSVYAHVEVEEEVGSIIIGERNRAALEALRRAMDEGHYRIALLYGAAHMPDLGRRLRVEFDLIPNRVQWITAWSLRNHILNGSSPLCLKKLALLIFSSVLA